MQSSLKKTLFLGLAAISLGAVTNLNSTNASAKSYATAGAFQSLNKIDATNRNVESTGLNAIYTKPGTVKGAKVVASKATMAKLATSKSSSDYFRVYGAKTTNRGSVYFKVVTMNGKYRGYIYGGSSLTAFAGGIKSAETTTAATVPAQTNNYYLKDATKNTLWTAPKYTQYKASKISLYGVSKNDTFTIDKAALKTREGSLYYHVTDTKNKSISGWVFADGLTTTAPSATATADNSVTIKYVDSNYTNLGSATFVTSVAGTSKDKPLSAKDTTNDKNTDNTDKADTSAFAKFVLGNTPTGYQVATTPIVTTGVKYGSTIQIMVKKAATSKVSFMVAGTSSVGPKSLSASDLASGKFPALTATEQKVFTGATSEVFDVSNLDLFKENGKLHKLIGATYTDKDGHKHHNEYTFNLDATKTGNGAQKDGKVNYGTSVTAYYTKEVVNVPAPSTATDTGNTNYTK